jgi:hypothetical protein
VVHTSHDGVLAKSNSVSVPAKVGEIVDQMRNICLKEEFDQLKVLPPILQHKNCNFFTLKVTKINNFPQHPHLNYSISFSDAARLMLSKFHLFWISKSLNVGPLGFCTVRVQ